MSLMARWRTTTVVQLCEAIRHSRDYSVLPILADAIQDTDCPESEFIETLRKCTEPQQAQRFVAIIYSDETEAAVRTVERLAVDLGPRAFCQEGDEYGESVPTDYFRLMRVGDRWANGSSWGERTVEHGSEDLRDDAWAGLPEFWEAYGKITGRAASGNPFSCTC